jgi:FKBP-type peptidyl-prolyl cis-trans isomerase SlyD
MLSYSYPVIFDIKLSLSPDRLETFDDKEVNVDFNHPLAGKDLMFSVVVISAREATADEDASGQVGGAQGESCGSHGEGGGCGCSH